MGKEEDVHYCTRCLSLRVIRHKYQDIDGYCDICKSTNIEETSIEDWEKQYVDKYGHTYLSEKTNRKSII